MVSFPFRRFTLPLLAALVLIARADAGKDWPTYLGNAARSGVSTEKLALPLRQLWLHQPRHAPSPAWPDPAKRDVLNRVENLRAGVAFDRAFHVAADKDAVYFGSSADHQVHALDAATGKTKWTHFTAGPIRFAPTLAGGNVYVGSDDGVAYCLRAGDGTLLWKHAGHSPPRFLPGNERIISTWPVRTSVIVDNGTAYFGAGLFPNQGVYLHAVDASDGSTRWTRKLDISAQGYLLASPDRLYVPTGRTSPTMFARSNGESLGELPGTGGAYALVVEGAVISGPGRRVKGLRAADTTNKEAIARFDGLRMVVDGDMAYLQSETTLTAFNRARYLNLSRQLRSLEKTNEELKKQIKEGNPESSAARLQKELRQTEESLTNLSQELASCDRWTEPCDGGFALVGTNGLLFVGGENKVAAISAKTGQTIWNAPVQGKAYGLGVAHGRLFVSTDRGAIHCFSAADANPGDVQVAASPHPAVAAPSSQICASAAKQIVARTGIGAGYCLMLGCKDGHLAYELARQTELQIVVVEPNADRVTAARRMLDGAGLYGTRVTVHEGPLEHLPFAPYFANLIVSETALLEGRLPPSTAEIHRVLRPSGGCVALAVRGDIAEVDELLTPARPMHLGRPSEARRSRAKQPSIKEWGEDVFSNWHVERQGDCLWGVARRGRLPGSGEWTHTYAEPGNSACSGDQLVAGNMALQWFGRPGPSRMVDRHFRNMPPLYKDGRLFVPGDGVVYAVDAYNGTILWQKEVPGSRRLGVFLGVTGMVVDAQSLYFVAGENCHRYNVQTGDRNTVYTCPQPAGSEHRQWGYVARRGEILLGSCRLKGTTYNKVTRDAQLFSEPVWYPNMKLATSVALFGIRQNRAEPSWVYQSGRIVDTTIAAGLERIHFVETTSPVAESDSTGRLSMRDIIDGGSQHLVTLDLETGHVLYKRRLDMANFQQPAYLVHASGILLLSGSKIVGGEQIRVSGLDAVSQAAGEETIHYYLQAYDAETGKTLWEADHPTELPVRGGHGEYNRHPTVVGDRVFAYPNAYDLQTGSRVEAWKFDRRGHGCGNISASSQCLFWRGGNPWMHDLGPAGGARRLNQVTRPGCFINIIPAGGLVLIPEASSGCTCGYSMQTSMAFVPESF